MSEPTTTTPPTGSKWRKYSKVADDCRRVRSCGRGSDKSRSPLAITDHYGHFGHSMMGPAQMTFRMPKNAPEYSWASASRAKMGATDEQRETAIRHCQGRRRRCLPASRKNSRRHAQEARELLTQPTIDRDAD